MAERRHGARADITRWQCWQLAHWGGEACEPLVVNRLVKKLLNLGPPDEAAVAKATEAFHKEAKLLDSLAWRSSRISSARS